MSFLKHGPRFLLDPWVRCGVLFLTPQFFMAVAFLLNCYFVLSLFDYGANITSTLLEVLWAYFPLLGSLTMFFDNWKKENEIAKLGRDLVTNREGEPSLSKLKLTVTQFRFLFYKSWALVLLIPITSFKIYWRFNCSECSSFWLSLLILEYIWIYIAVIDPYFWIKDNWNKSPRDKLCFGFKVSKDECDCVFYYFLATACLLISAFTYRLVDFLSPGSYELRIVSCIEDFFFVLCPILASVRWIVVRLRKHDFYKRFEEERKAKTPSIAFEENAIG